MKQIIILLVLIVLGYVVISSPVLAEGDKVRGDGAIGPAYQLGECPFVG